MTQSTPYDNTLTENLLLLLKNECIYMVKLNTYDETHLAIDEYIHF